MIRIIKAFQIRDFHYQNAKISVIYVKEFTIFDVKEFTIFGEKKKKKRYSNYGDLL